MVFRLPANLGRNALRVTRAVAPPRWYFGALSLMGVADAPLLNAAGLVTALLALMLWATRAIMRKGSRGNVKNARPGNTVGKLWRWRGNTGSRSLVQDLALLAALHSRGQLTDEEFASIKAKLLEG